MEITYSDLRPYGSKTIKKLLPYIRRQKDLYLQLIAQILLKSIMEKFHQFSSH